MSTTKRSAPVLVFSGDTAQVKEGIEGLNEGKVNIVGEKMTP